MVCKEARRQFRAKAYSKEEKLMNQTTTNELKSEKLKLGKVFLIIWLVAVVAFFSFAAVKYAGYKEIQDAGLVCAALASSEYDSPDREEVIHDLYMDMTRTSYLGQNWNEYSGAIRDAMEDALEAMGYDDLTYIPHYFRYVGFSEYFMGYFLFSHAPVLMLCIYAVLLVLLIFTVLYLTDRRGQVSVEEAAVTCQKKPGKSMQFMIQDINSVELVGLKGLKLKGSGINFKTLFLKNGPAIKTAIMDKKMVLTKNNPAPAAPAGSNMDELKQLKELLDTGVISQEEFDTKKKQLLGL